jgi:hypothetical protein
VCLCAHVCQHNPAEKGNSSGIKNNFCEVIFGHFPTSRKQIDETLTAMKYFKLFYEFQFRYGSRNKHHTDERCKTDIVLTVFHVNLVEFIIVLKKTIKQKF